jgi:copper(I)-binding protein
MKLRNLFSAASVALFTSTPLFAGDLMVMDAYARVASKVAKSGAAFMMIHNHSDQDDRLIAAASDVGETCRTSYAYRRRWRYENDQA